MDGELEGSFWSGTKTPSVLLNHTRCVGCTTWDEWGIVTWCQD